MLACQRTDFSQSLHMALSCCRLQRLYSAFEPLTSPTHCMLILAFILLQKVAPIAAPYEKR